MTHLTSPLTSPRTVGSSRRAAGAHAPGRTLLITVLLLAGRALERLATRLAHGGTEQHSDGREFHVVEQDGRHIGMLYEDGRLVALLPEIGRL